MITTHPVSTEPAAIPNSLLAYACSVAAAGPVLRVDITECRITTDLGNRNYPRFGAPGPVATTFGNTTLTGRPVSFCVQATVYYVDGGQVTTSRNCLFYASV
jgi:hypothetical protein